MFKIIFYWHPAFEPYLLNFLHLAPQFCTIIWHNEFRKAKGKNSFFRNP